MPTPVRIGSFRGERPGTGIRNLTEGYSQSARNCRLINGEIVPINAVVDVETVTSVLDHRATTADGYESTWQYVQNRKFSRENLFWTTGSGWSIIGGKAQHEPGDVGSLDQSLDRDDAQPRIKEFLSYTVEFTVSDYVAGTVTPMIGGVSGTGETSNGDKSQAITSGEVDKLLKFDSDSNGDFKIDTVSVTVNMGSFAAAAGGSPAWLRLAWAASDNKGEYDGWTLNTVGGTGSGQSKTITQYFGNTNGKFHVAEVDSDWGTLPDDTTIYELYKPVTTEEVETLKLFNQGQEFTFTAAQDSGGVWEVNATDHKLLNGEIVTFRSAGTLPAGLSAGVPYFVVERMPDTFRVSLTLGGAEVSITDAGTGVHTAAQGLWLRWGTDVDVVRTPVAGDEDQLTIWTGQGVPQISYKGLLDDKPAELTQAEKDAYTIAGYPVQSFTLGVPEPRIDEDDDVEFGGGAGDDFYLTYQNNADNVDLFSDLQAVGWDGTTHKNFIVVVNNAIRIGSGASGTGFQVQAGWPSGTMINFTNNGTINGGHGAGAASSGGNGGNAGRAVYVVAGFGTALDTITADNTTDVLTTTSPHVMLAGESVHLSHSAGSFPTGLDGTTRYYIINPGGSTFQLALTAGGTAIDFSTNGSNLSVHNKTMFFENATGAEIYGGGGGGSAGGLARGTNCSTDQKGDCVDSTCCSAGGGVGGKGYGNTANAGGTNGGCCGGATCGGSCTSVVKCGGNGASGGGKAAVGGTGTNGGGNAPMWPSGSCTGATNAGVAGTAGAAIDGISTFKYTDNGTTTGTQIN